MLDSLACLKEVENKDSTGRESEKETLVLTLVTDSIIDAIIYFTHNTTQHSSEYTGCTAC